MNQQTLLIGGGAIAAAGLIASLWGRIKSLLKMLTSFVIVEVNVNDIFLQSSILQALHARYRKSKFAPRAFTTGFMFARATNKYRHILFEQLNATDGMYWHGIKPIFVKSRSPEKWNIKGASAKDEIKSESEEGAQPLLELRFLRGTFKVDSLVKEGTEILNQIDANRYRIEYIHGSSGGAGASSSEEDAARSRVIFQHSHVPVDAEWKNLGPPRRPKPLGDMVLKEEAQHTVTEIRRWLKSRGWFIERNMAWRRGYLLHGKPGCGKTSFVRAVAEEFDLPLFVFDLASLSNRELATNWQHVNSSAPIRIILIEDIDSVFDLRVNKTKTDNFQGVTFDKLINTIDGVEQQDGLLLFITTNEIRTVDPAIASRANRGDISSRPGRIDRSVSFAQPGPKGLTKIALRIMGEMSGIEEMVEEGKNDTPAQFQERCCRKALDDYFKEKP